MTAVVLVATLCVEEVDVSYGGMRDANPEGVCAAFRRWDGGDAQVGKILYDMSGHDELGPQKSLQ